MGRCSECINAGKYCQDPFTDSIVWALIMLSKLFQSGCWLGPVNTFLDHPRQSGTQCNQRPFPAPTFAAAALLCPADWESSELWRCRTALCGITHLHWSQRKPETHLYFNITLDTFLISSSSVTWQAWLATPMLSSGELLLTPAVKQGTQER